MRGRLGRARYRLEICQSLINALGAKVDLLRQCVNSLVIQDRRSVRALRTAIAKQGRRHVIARGKDPVQCSLPTVGDRGP
jgi:hypothetical protein